MAVSRNSTGGVQPFARILAGPIDFLAAILKRLKHPIPFLVEQVPEIFTIPLITLSEASGQADLTGAGITNGFDASGWWHQAGRLETVMSLGVIERPLTFRMRTTTG